MPNHRLPYEQERGLALAELCGVSEPVLQSHFGRGFVTARVVIAKRAPDWHDPLVDSFKAYAREGYRFGNAVHVFLAAQNRADEIGLENAFDSVREARVVHAVQQDIFEPRWSNYFSHVPCADTPSSNGRRGIAEDVSTHTALENAVHFLLIERLVIAYEVLRERKPGISAFDQLDAAYQEVKDALFHHAVQQAGMYVAETPASDSFTQCMAAVARNPQGVDRILDTLTFREREILRILYDIDHTGQKFDVRDVARCFNITPINARNIAAKAIRKLQEPSRLKLLQRATTEEEL